MQFQLLTIKNAIKAKNSMVKEKQRKKNDTLLVFGINIPHLSQDDLHLQFGEGVLGLIYSQQISTNKFVIYF